LSRENDLAVWVADVPDSRDMYVGLFNIKDVLIPATQAATIRRGRGPQVAREGPAEVVTVSLSDLGFTAPVSVRDLWSKQDLGQVSGSLARTIPYHGAGLYRISPR
jgi:alpha-galactosidase